MQRSSNCKQKLPTVSKKLEQMFFSHLASEIWEEPHRASVACSQSRSMLIHGVPSQQTFAQAEKYGRKLRSYKSQSCKKPAEPRRTLKVTPQIGSGQEVCFCPSRPDPERNAREQDGTRTGRDGPHLGTWMGPKHCKTKHMVNLDGTTSDPGWDLDGPRIEPRRGSGWHPPESVTDF